MIAVLFEMVAIIVNWKLIVSHFLVAVIALTAWILLFTPTGEAPVPQQQAPIVLVTEAEPSESGISVIRQQFNASRRKDSIFAIQSLAYQEADSLSLPDIKGRLANLLNSEDPLYYHNIAMIYLEKLIETSPLDAVRIAETYGGTLDRQQALFGGVLTNWVLYDADAALDYLESMTNRQMKIVIASRLAYDPVFSRSSDIDRLRQILGHQYEQIVSMVQQRQRPAVEQFREAITKPDLMRAHHIGRAFYRWWQESPEDAMAALETMDDSLLNAVLPSMINAIANQEPQLALQIARLYAPGNHQIEGQVLALIAGQNPDRGWADLEDYIYRTGNSQVLSQAIGTLAQHDLSRALALSSELGGLGLEGTIDPLVLTYIQQDPIAAMDWLMAQNDNNAMITAARFLPQVDLQLAEKYLSEADNPQFAAQLLEGIAQQQARVGFADTMTWLKDYEDVPGYSNAMNSAIITSMHQQPAIVAEYLLDHAENETLTNTFNTMGSTWGRIDSEAAIDWALDLPEGNNRNRALVGVAASAIYSGNFETALTVMDQLPDEQARVVRYQYAYRLIQQQVDVGHIARQLDLTEEEVKRLQQQQQQNIGSIAITNSS